MYWTANIRTLVSPPDTSFNFICNYKHQHFTGMDVNNLSVAESKQNGLVPAMDKSNYGSQEWKKRLTSNQLDSLERSFQEEIKLDPDRKMKLSQELGLQPRQIAVWFQNRRARWKTKQLKHLCDARQERKKRLTSNQLESLERSFQEEIKLDPDRKMKLSQELGLQPRQIAVWFQNRRTRWKTKQLEHLCDALKQELDIVSKEKHELQEEVMKLKKVLREQATPKNQVSTGYSEITYKETVESTMVAIHSSSMARRICHHQIGESNNNLFKIDEYKPVSTPYWALLPSYR